MPERMKTMRITKRYLMQLRLKLDNLKEAMSKKKLMAEDLNGYFSSVLTREDISSLSVPDAKFQEAKSDYLGQLIVTPGVVAKRIQAMKDNKSPGVDGIPPTLLMGEK